MAPIQLTGLHYDKRDEFHAKYCIICQSQKLEGLKSTENCRIKVVDAAKIRKDVIFDRLNTLTTDQHFKYH